MAVMADPMEPLAGTGVKRVDDAMIDGKPYPVLRVTGHASADVMTLVVDPATHLLRRVTFDSRKQFTFPGEPEPKSAETVFDYTTVTPGAAFKPGAVRVVAARGRGRRRRPPPGPARPRAATRPPCWKASRRRRSR